MSIEALNGFENKIKELTLFPETKWLRLLFVFWILYPVADRSSFENSHNVEVRGGIDETAWAATNTATISISIFLSK